jgi:hypothetical protein
MPMPRRRQAQFVIKGANQRDRPITNIWPNFPEEEGDPPIGEEPREIASQDHQIQDGSATGRSSRVGRPNNPG